MGTYFLSTGPFGFIKCNPATKSLEELELSGIMQDVIAVVPGRGVHQFVMACKETIEEKDEVGAADDVSCSDCSDIQVGEMESGCAVAIICEDGPLRWIGEADWNSWI